MPNIMINSYCNLKYPYCFADNEITDCNTKKNMSVEDFAEEIVIGPKYELVKKI